MERIEKYCYTKKDFKLDWFSGTGPGGQNRNKVQTCVRITHIPSGLQAVGQTERTRQGNFKYAFKNLSEKLKVWIQAEINKESVGRVTSDERIRTYHFADNRITDHKSGVTIAASQLEKDFGNLIEARNKACISEKINDSSK